MHTGECIAGRYRLEARLGRGGMGEVWRSIDLELGRPVAVKVLLELDAGADLLQRFRREAAIGAQFQHPGIAVVHDIGQHDERLFIVMELLEGEDLARVVAHSRHGLSIAETLELTEQTAQALSVMHARRVMHRDLKPANLFRLTDGRLKICDFGIARSLQATHNATHTGRMMGTAPYMAPEQWRGRDIGTPADMYALGCVIYELLTGTPPFAPIGEPLAMMHQHFEQTPTPLRSIRPEIPAELEALVARLLSKDPSARPDAVSTAEHLRAIGRTTTDPHTAETAIDPACAPTLPPGGGPESPTLAQTKPTDGAEQLPPQQFAPNRRRLILGGAAALATASSGTALGLYLAGRSAPASQPGAADGPRHSAASGSSPQTSTTSSPQPTTTPDPRLLATLTGHTATVNSVAFSPNGKILASGSGSFGQDNTIRLWDLATRTSIATLIGHTDAVNSVAFSPDGKTLASASADKTIRLWDVATQASSVLYSGTAAVNSVALSPDGRTLASGSSSPGSTPGATIQIWDLTSRRSTTLPVSDVFDINSLSFNPDGKYLASGGNGGNGGTTGVVYRWDLATGAGTAGPPADGDGSSVAFSPDGSVLASGGWNGPYVQLWEYAASSTIDLTGSTGTVSSIIYLPDGKTLAGGGTDTIWTWNLATDTHTVLTNHASGITSLACSPDGTMLASGSGDDNIYLWKPA